VVAVSPMACASRIGAESPRGDPRKKKPARAAGTEPSRAIQEKSRGFPAPRPRKPRGPAGDSVRGARVDLDHDGWGRSRRSGGDGWPSWSSSSSRQRARGVAALPVQFWERPSSRGVGDDHAPSDRLIVRRIMWLKPKRRGLAWSPCSIRSQQM